MSIPAAEPEIWLISLNIELRVYMAVRRGQATRYASHVSHRPLEPDQREALRLIADHELSFYEPLPGRSLRAALKKRNLASRTPEETIASIAPPPLFGAPFAPPEALVEHATLPGGDDAYQLAAGGLLHPISGFAGIAAKVAEDVAAFLSRHADEPRFGRFTWQTLRDEGFIEDGVSATMVAVVLQKLRLAEIPTMSRSPEGEPIAYTFAAPRDIEWFVQGRDIGDIVLRLHALERAAAVQFGEVSRLPRHASPPAAAIYVHNYHGEVVMGTKVTSNITNSNVGANAVGIANTARGSAQGEGAPIPPQEFLAHLTKLQQLLAEEQDRMSDNLYEGMNTFLRLLRKVEIGQATLDAQVAKVKETVDHLAARDFAKELRELPQGLQTVKAMLDHPLTAVAGAIIGASPTVAK